MLTSSWVATISVVALDYLFLVEAVLHYTLLCGGTATLLGKVFPQRGTTGAKKCCIRSFRLRRLLGSNLRLRLRDVGAVDADAVIAQGTRGGMWAG